MGIIGKGSLVNQKEVKSDFDEVSKAYDKMLKDMISTADKVKESGSLTDLMQVDKETQQNLKKLTTLQNKVVQLEKKLADALKASAGFYAQKNRGLKQEEALKKELIKTDNQLASAESQLTNEYKQVKKAQVERQQQAKKVNAAIKEEVTGEKKAAAAKRTNAAQTKQLNGILKEHVQNLTQTNPRLKEMGRYYKQLESESKKAANAKERLKNRTNALGKSFKNALSSLKQYVAAYIGFQTLIRGVKDIFQLTKTLDSIDFAQRKVIKSQLELAETQEFLSRLAEDYGSDLVAMSERYIKFRAATNSSNLTAKETQQIFESVTKASATLGLKTDELRGVYLALEQMISKNKVTTEELRRQLGERLPGAFDIMARSMGVSTEKLNDMLKAGEVMSEKVLPNFAKEIERAYGIENVKRVDTLVAAQNRLRTAWIELVDALEAGDTFKNFFNTLASGVKWVERNLDLVSMLAKVLTNLGITYLILATKTKIANSEIFKSTKLKIKEILATKTLSTANKGLSVSLALVSKTAKAAWAALGGWFGLIATGVSILLPFLSTLGKTKSEIKSFNQEVGKQQGKLRILFDSLKNAEKGTREWNFAMREINKEYSETLGFIIDEKTSIGQLTEAHKKLNKVVKSSIAERRLNKEMSELIEKQLDAELDATELLESSMDGYSETMKKKASAAFLDMADSLSNLTEKERNAIIESTGFSNKMLSLGLNVKLARLLMDGLVGKLSDYDRVITQIKAKYSDFILPPEYKEGDFDIKAFKNNLNQLKTEYAEYSKLKNDEDKKYYKSKSSWLSDDYDTELEHLKDLYAAHGSNAEARIALALRISEIQEKNNKKSRDNTLKIQEEIDKATLKSLEEKYEKQLSKEIEFRRKRGDSEDQINDYIKDQDSKIKKALLGKEKELALNRLGLVKAGSIEYLKILTNVSDIELDLAKLTTEEKIRQAEREYREKERILRKELALNKYVTQQKISVETESASKKVLETAKALKNGEINQIKYAEIIKGIDEKLQTDIIDLEIAGLEERKKIKGLEPEEILKINSEIERLNAVKFQKEVDSEKRVAEEKAAVREQVKSLRIELINEAFNFFQKTLENELAAIESTRDFEVALAGSNAEERIKAERKYEKEKLKIEQKQARTDKAQAAFNIIASTAKGIADAASKVVTLPLIPLIAGIGALQLATVLATPVPKFAEGTDGTKGGPAIVGDKKGDSTLRKKGGSELITLPSGESFLSPDSPTLMDLPKGSVVKSHSETQKILANAAMNTAYERIDMGKSEGYLKDIRDKENTTYSNGYKIVKRKGFTGRYATR